ncbi:hypothetical protein TrLO_g9720, partial [Triparma laevis f. longispina]
GSGGSILIDTKSLVGSGTVQANGGSPGDGGGAGSGGRIAIYLETQGNTTAGSAPTVAATVTAYGGTHSQSSSCGGAAGTIFIRHGTLGVLEIDNNDNSRATTAYTPMPTIYSTAEGEDNSTTTSTGFKGPLFGTEVKRKARVYFQGTTWSASARPFSSCYFTLSEDSNMKGAKVPLHVHQAALDGDITATSLIDIAGNKIQSGSAEIASWASASASSAVNINSASKLQCSGCAVKVGATGSTNLAGDVTSGTVELVASA